MIDSTDANSSVGTTTPVNQEAFSRLNVNAAFFVPVVITANQSLILWVLTRAETVKAVEGGHLLGTRQLVDRCGNSCQHPPYSITTVCVGLYNSTKKVLVMCTTVPMSSAFTPEDCFTVSSSELANKSFPIDPVTVGTSRALALLRLLMSSSDGCTKNGSFSISHADVMNNLWLLEMALSQVEQVIVAWCEAGADHGI